MRKFHFLLNLTIATIFIFSLLPGKTLAAPQLQSQIQTTEYTTPTVAILASETTQALDDANAWYSSWHYYVLHNSLEEVLRSDGTSYEVLTDADVLAGDLLLPGGKPRYPILFSLASEAVSDAEVTGLRDYVSAGGFLFSGSSSFTRQANGTARGDFALATEMGLHISGSPSWHSNTAFIKQHEHRLIAGIPSGTLYWTMIDNSESTGAGSFPVLNTTAGDIELIANDSNGPLVATKKYGLGQFIYHGAFQPLIGIGGYVSDTYSYLIYRNAIEWAFEQFNLPIIKVSPWPYEYDAALTIRKDFENTPYRIQSILASSQVNASVEAKGDFYVCTGTLRAGSPDTQLSAQAKLDTIEDLKTAVEDYGATIGSHNGGLPQPGVTDPNSYAYWHWGPDQTIYSGPIGGYVNGYEYAKASIQISFADINGWMTGLDNGRAGCGVAHNCPSIWVSPNFLSARENSRQILDELYSISMGEQNMGPFPHWSLSYYEPGKLFNSIVLPTSEWYIGSSVAQSLEYSYGQNHTIQTVHDAVDFYYNLGALVNIYGHEPETSGVHYEYPIYSATKPRIWKTNVVGVYDWWVLRTPVSVIPTYTQMGKLGVAHATVSGGTDPETAIEMALPNYSSGAIDDVTVLINGVPADSTQYRLTSYGVKVKVGSSASNVEVRYTPLLTWQQTDWSGGAGQTTWSEINRYDSATGLDTSVAGQVHLADTAGVFGSIGTLLSSAFDGGNGRQWLSVNWTATLPALTGFRVRVRSAATSDGLGSSTWSDWISTSGASISGQTGRWIQYEVELTSTNSAVTPVLDEIHILYDPGPGVNLTQLSPLIGDSGATVIVSAYLVDDNNQPVGAGLPVRFTVTGLPPVSGTTDAAGYASASLILNLAPGTYALSAAFDGNEEYAPTTASQNLTVTAPWPAWTQDSQTDFALNTNADCLDLSSTPGSVRLQGQIVGQAEESGPFSLGVGEEIGPFTLGSQTFGFRNRLFVDNPNGTTLGAGYTLNLVLDTASLVTATKLRTDGNDLRIARDTGSGMVELDRLIVSGVNTTSTQIAFKLQAAISAGGRDSSYYIYYGKSDAGTPPVDPANVYFLWDDFNGTTVDTTRWTQAGTVTVAGGTALIDTAGDLLSKTTATYGLMEARIKTGILSNVVFWGWEDGPISAPNFIVYQRIPSIKAYIHKGTLTNSFDLSVPVPDGTIWHDYSIRWNPGQVDWFVDGVAKATFSSSTAIPNTQMSANINAYQDTLEVDWVRIRLYASVEPVINLQTSSSYQYKRGVEVNNIASIPLPSGYAVKLTLDTASLTGTGKLLASGNDLRLIWMNGTTPVELDRIADTPFNTSATDIWFKTQATISANSSDTNYYIYYGNPTAGPAPANASGVFAFWDGFDGSTLDTTIWNRTGTVSISGGQAHLNTTSNIISKSSLTYGKLEMRIKAGGQNNVMFWGWEQTPADADNLLVFQEQPSPGFFNAIYGQLIGHWSQIVINDPTDGFTVWHTYGVDWESNYAQWTIDGVESLHINSGVPTVPMLININAYSSIPLDVDWVRVRQQFSPEPIVTLATTHIEYTSGPCEMLSVPFDTGQLSMWKYLIWDTTTPPETNLQIQVRTANSEADLNTATWVDYPQSGLLITNPTARWIQYKATLSTSNVLITPDLQKVTIYYLPTSSIALQTGWNLITLPLQPVSPFTAQTWLQDINAHGGHCSEIDQWVSERWNSYILGDLIDPFDITMGTGYFVLCDQPGSWIQQGIRLSSGATINLSIGYNLVGFPHTQTSYTAETLLTAINSHGGNCSEINRRINESWVSHFLGDGEFNNFSILPFEGYFVNCSVASSFTP